MADGGAEQAGERQLLLVVEVVLVAEEDHLVGQQGLADLFDRGRGEVAPEAHAVDPGTDAAPQLGDCDLTCHFLRSYVKGM